MHNNPPIDDVVRYLSAHGWTVSGRWRNGSIWSLGDFEVLVPPSDSMIDTRSRLRELTLCVADAEDRSPEAVWQDLRAPALDVLSYRTAQDAESIEFSAASRTVLALGELISVCAAEVIDGARSLIPGVTTTRDRVRELLNESRLSMTGKPLTLKVGFPIGDGDPNHVSRRTTVRISTMSAAVLQAADVPEAHSTEYLARHGVSAAECRAFAELIGPDNPQAFELDFHWSWLAPRPDETVSVPAEAGERVRGLSNRRARQQPEPVSGVVRGSIIALSDDPGGARRRIKIRGTLELDGAAAEGIRTVTVTAPDDRTYATALSAHRDGHTVRAAGSTTRHRRGTEITVASDGFTVIDDALS
ncbi:hypothetical protein [Nocardia sp. NPDC005825]|uniref:hypothetical protein n=1 Tax=unclassified Nocardia TaxID=2637762 RepID=UPI0033D76F61